MNRTYVIESTFSGTGATADHRYPVRPSQVKAYLVKLEDEVRRLSGQPRLTGEFTSGAIIDDAKWVTAIAKDLAANAGASLVTVGAGQSPDVHALAHRLNALLGNVGKTINYTTEPSESNGVASLRGLTEKMAKGEVAFLAMLGGNPVYDAPVDFKFGDALAKVSFSMHLSLYRDETSLASTLHVPASHYLESWGDSRRWDGTIAVVQPLIRPLYASRTKGEALAAITTGKAGDDKTRLGTTIDEAFKPAQPAETEAEVAAAAVAEVTDEAAAPAAVTTEDPELKALKLLNGNERRWRKIVHRGLIDGTAYPVIDATVQPFSVSNWDKTTVKASSNLANGEFELVFFEDGKVHDGRFANNGWLQETPNGITKLTWDNAALVSPKTARKLGLVEEDVVTIKSGDQSIEAAVSVLPGQPTGTVGLAFGYGRTESGVVGGSKSQGIASPGVSAYNIRTADGQWHRQGVSIEKTGRSTPSPVFKITMPSTRQVWRSVSDERLLLFAKWTWIPTRRIQRLRTRSTTHFLSTSFFRSSTSTNTKVINGVCLSTSHRVPAVTRVSLPAPPKTISQLLARTRSRRVAKCIGSELTGTLSVTRSRLRCFLSHSGVCSVKTPHVSRFAQLPPPFTAKKALTIWSTTAASVPVTARTTARSRYDALTTTTTMRTLKTRRTRLRRWSSTLKYLFEFEASWKSAPTAFSASKKRSSWLLMRSELYAMAIFKPHALRHARRMPSSLVTSMTRIAESRSSKHWRALTRCSSN